MLKVLKAKCTSKRPFENAAKLAKARGAATDFAGKIAHASGCSACRTFDRHSSSKSPTLRYASNSASSPLGQRTLAGFGTQFRNTADIRMGKIQRENAFRERSSQSTSGRIEHFSQV